MKKYILITLIAVVLLALIFHAAIGDLVAQGGQFLYWRLGMHPAGVFIIKAGDSFAFWKNYFLGA